jgi:ankyrin repeat protein
MKVWILAAAFAASLCGARSAGAQEIFDAVKASDLATVARLVGANATLANLSDKDKNTPLHLAAAGGFVPIAEYLLEKGAVIETPNAVGNTPLHAAAIAGAVGTIDLLLQRRARIDAANAQQNSPLQEAIFNGKDEAARLLIERGADLRRGDNLGRTALHFAARYNRKAIVELLIAKGVDVNSRAAQERTPLNLLTLMTQHVDVARILVQNGADVDAADSQGTMPLEHAVHQGSLAMIDLLLDSGAGFRTAPDRALGTLRLAAATGSARLFKVVAEKVGDDLFRDGSENASTMNTAISGGSVEIVKLLLAKKVPIDPSADITGATPLHRAVSANASGLIELLVAQGVDVNKRTNNGRSAYNIAETRKNQEAMSLLAKLGADTDPQRFPILTGPYLGQPLPGKEATRFAPGIVFFNHSSLTVSPDGQEMYWGSTSSIMTTRLQNGRWTLPEVAPFSGGSTTPMYDDVPFVAPDNKRLFFTSLRPIVSEAPGKENIWYVERTTTGWSAPKPVGAAVNALTLHWQVSVSRAGTLYFAGRGEEGRGIYASRPVSGEYGKPVKLPAAINTTGGETCPYIAPDEAYLIFARVAPDGRSTPLFVSFKSKDGTWGEPVRLNVPNVGPTAIVSPDGKYLFLGGITWMSASIIEELRPKDPRPVVHGG